MPCVSGGWKPPVLRAKSRPVTADFYGNENADPKIAGANGPTILDDISEAGREKWIDSILTEARSFADEHDCATS